MTEHGLYFLLAFLFIVYLGPTLFFGHLEYRVVDKKEYPKRPGEPGIRYVCRVFGITLYYGLKVWKDLAVAVVRNSVGTVHWLIFGAKMEENNEQ